MIYNLRHISQFHTLGKARVNEDLSDLKYSVAIYSWKDNHNELRVCHP